MNFTFRKLSFLLFPALLCTANMQAHAFNKSPGHVYPPIHIKSGVSTLVPSGLSPSQILNAYGISAIAHQGEGQTIAIVDAYDNPNIESDLAVFSTQYGLPTCTSANGCFTKVFSRGKPPADAGWSGEIALDVEWVHAIAPSAKIILVEAFSDSFPDMIYAVRTAVHMGATVVSMSWGGSEFANQDMYNKYFNVWGVTFTASSGDSGNGTIFPSTSPYVVSVGGTTLSTNGSGNYLGETAWDGSGGGLSRIENQPTYQQSFPIPNNPLGKRGVPDISFNADPNTGFSVYDSMNGGWLVVGGTSAGAPAWAALFAIVNSARSSKLPSAPALLYSIGKTQYTANFNDITTGSNGDCGYYCNATTGYDYVTGLGTPKANVLLQSLITSEALKSS